MLYNICFVYIYIYWIGELQNHWSNNFKKRKTFFVEINSFYLVFIDSIQLEASVLSFVKNAC